MIRRTWTLPSLPGRAPPFRNTKSMCAIIANRSDAVSRFRQTAVAGMFLFATAALGVSELRADEIITVEE